MGDLWAFLHAEANRPTTREMIHAVNEMLLDFGRLEWLVLAPVQLPAGEVEAVRTDPKLFVRALVKDVSSLRHLERLGLAFPRTILVAHQPGVLGTVTGMDAVEHCVRQLNSHIFAKLPALKQVAFLHGTTVLRAVRGADAAIRFSIENDLDRHAFPFGTLY
ncbi:hypothetical protein FOC1_g10013377 [Fusarium oxysporum f. sp. cubense race 1]|uniref:Uncharacterized protein n=1 Tax=Fusarium oxysporum f. sp. cubense (strain race 1) TaxID=1229664 RepID=N4UA54_FUSC1|nr:hypothetical protein FOC1_g10013377 [Fusarium oxysporum f. sp. cubense race 1]